MFMDLRQENRSTINLCIKWFLQLEAPKKLRCSCEVEFMLLEIKRGYIVIGEVSRGGNFEATDWYRHEKNNAKCRKEKKDL